MWQFTGSRIFMVVIVIGVAHGILVVGPKFIRANQDYTVVITNFNPNTTKGKVDLKLRMEGHTDDGRNVLDITKTTDVRKYANKIINFNLPGSLSDGSYKITIDGQRGYSFHKEADLVYLSKSISGLIQINKPVFKPGDTVQFRVIVLDTELKPPARVKTIHVEIQDPQHNGVRKWSSAKLYAGVFENDFQIAPTPMLGLWNISVLADGEELVSKTFEVKEYVLSSFDVEVLPSIIPLEEHQGLKLTIAANYHFGKPVNGLAKMELYLQDDKLDQKNEFNVTGTRQVELRFKEDLDVNHHQQNVIVKTTFIEQYTNRTMVKESHITVYKYKYRVDLIKDTPQFRPGLPFKCALQFRYHDGTPATGISGKVEVTEIEYEAEVTSNNEGLIKLDLHPTNNTEGLYITFSADDGFFFEELVNKVDVVTDVYIKLELKSPMKLNQTLKFMVTCSERMTFFVYYVVSKGNIVDSGFMRPNKQINYSLTLITMVSMIPKAKIIVATVAKGIVVYDVLDIDFKDLRNNFEMSIDEEEVKPGRQIELRMTGRPRAYVWLASYDKGLLYYNKHHDLFWEDILKEFDGFHAIAENEHDMLHSMGLFGRTLDGIEFEGAHDTSARNGLHSSNPITKLISYRTNFQESWLWKNVTIQMSGTYKTIEIVPDTTTSWYLTAFSIHPEYGLGIIKKPIQFTTVQPFYIVENLPNSIQRGEVVELQFVLFNFLEGEYTAAVTLYNVDNQTEFIGRPSTDLSFTKSISVPSKVGVQVSFLVKARKLGEMTINVKASTMLGLETDALEKVILVLPNTFMQSKRYSDIFWLDKYSKQSFPINLYIPPKAVRRSTKIEFRVKDQLYTTLTHNFHDLFLAPPGAGEQNMINFIPNIFVLDYLNAIGSKDYELMDKATNLVRLGYQNQMRYRKADGSFGVWQSGGGNVFMTALVAKSMETASKYISVDNYLIEKAYDWLASKQHSSGRFDEVGSIIHQDMQGGLRKGIALTSYVITALLENENSKVKHAVVIQRAMNYLSRQVGSVTNAYDLSIATYALMLNGHSMKDMAFKKLLEMSTVTNNGTNMERYWSTTNSIEATAYALLSFVISEKYVDSLAVMRWLVKQNYIYGSFPHTQNTVVGLTALTKFAEINSPSRNNYTVHLKLRNSTRSFHINSPDANIINYDLPEDTKDLEIDIVGVGTGLLEVNYQYGLELENFENRFKLRLEGPYLYSNGVFQLRVCASFIPIGSSKRSNMTLVEMTLPNGYAFGQNPISSSTYEYPIRKIKLRNNGTSVVVYYDYMGKEWNCLTVAAYRIGKVALKRSAYVVVSDYYNPTMYAVKLYEVGA